MKQLPNPSRIACLFAAVLISMAALLSCSQYDDTGIKDSIVGLQERIDSLEKYVHAMQSNIDNLKATAERLSQNVTADTVVETDDGWIIRMSDGKDIVLTDGKNGDNATGVRPPSITIIEEDGMYWWGYVDETGEHFFQDGDNRFPCTSATPQIRINEDGNWEISLDGGLNWDDTGVKAVGEDGKDGDSFIDSITDDEENFYILLGNGSSIVLPKTQELSLTLDCEETEYFTAGETRVINYTVTGSGIITFTKPNGWKVSIDGEASSISITAPAEDNLFAETAGVISVILTDAQGKNFAALLNVAIKILDPEINIITTSLIVPAEGGECRIDYEIINPVKGGQISAGTESTWLSDFRCSDEGVTFTAAPNDKSVRATYVIISYSYNDKVIEASVSVTQEAPTSGYYYDNIMTGFSGSYFGKYGNAGEDNWTCRIYTDEYEYFFDFYGPEPEKGSELPPAGQYVLSEPGMTDVMTFSVDNSYFYNLSIDYQLEFMSGTLDISYEGDNIIIDAKLMDEDEYTHHALYKGPAEF